MQVPRTTQRRSAARAFTLMEVLVVVAIIVVLAGIGTVAFRYLADSKENICKASLKQVETAVMGYYYKHQQMPDNLEILTQRIDGSTAYLRPEDIRDPWGRPYIYEPGNMSSTGAPRIYSNGDPAAPKIIANWNP
jgi:general secretion pathway protein G